MSSGIFIVLYNHHLYIVSKHFHHFQKEIPYPLRSNPTLPLSSVQLSRVRLYATPWPVAHQASLSITNFWSFLKLMSIETVMLSNHLILCHPLLLPPSVSPSIRVFSNESALHIRWPRYWSFSFSISPYNEYSGLDGLVGSPCCPRDSQVFYNATVQKHQFFSAQLSLYDQPRQHI